MDEQETLARVRLAAQVARNSTPPHCHPVTILILILATGTIFIGMTMTIVAHWPGVSVGIDPLSIPGPIILTLGGLMFIFGSALVCYFQRKETQKRGEKFVSFATTLSRMNLELSQHNRHGSQILDKEDMKGKKDKNGEWIDDDPEVRGGARRKYEEGDHRGQLEEVITSTTKAIDAESSLAADDEEHLPLPVRTKKIKSGVSKTKEKLGKINEADKEVIGSYEPLLESDVKIKSKPRSKKKKVNTNYSRDVLEMRRLSEETAGRQGRDQSHELMEVAEGSEVDSTRPLKIRVKAGKDTVVSVKHFADEEAAIFQAGKITDLS